MSTACSAGWRPPRQFDAASCSEGLEGSLNRLNEIVLGKRGITAGTALRMARLFKMSPQFWMRLQADWDLASAHWAEGTKSILITRAIVTLPHLKES